MKVSLKKIIITGNVQNDVLEVANAYNFLVDQVNNMDKTKNRLIFDKILERYTNLVGEYSIYLENLRKARTDFEQLEKYERIQEERNEAEENAIGNRTKQEILFLEEILFSM